MNSLPETVREFLEECSQSIDDRGELPSSKRKEIYEKIEKYSQEKSDNLAHYRRAKLELICVWKVLDKWGNCRLTTNSVKKGLELAEKYLKGKAEKKELEKICNLLYTEAENLMYQGEEYFTAGYVGYACLSAINAVLYDLNFDTVGIPEIENQDPDDWTACFYACCAYCGGATWENNVGDDSKRREFWEWFLSDAVRSIWNDRSLS